MREVSYRALRRRRLAVVPIVFVSTVGMVCVCLFLANLAAYGVFQLLFPPWEQWSGWFVIAPWQAGTVAVALVAAAYLRIRSAALGAVEANEASELGDAPLIERVERLATEAGVRPPTVVATPSETPTAFSLGLAPGPATLVVTDGLRELLDENELDAVLLHELAHQRNGDVAVTWLAGALLVVLHPLAIPRTLASLVSWFAMYGRTPPSALTTTFEVAFKPVSLALGPVFVLARATLVRVFLHYSERAADTAAAIVHGDPDVLADAIRRLQWRVLDADGSLSLEAIAVVPLDYAVPENRGLVEDGGVRRLQPRPGRRASHVRSLSED